jgi:hypothetical protein
MTERPRTCPTCHREYRNLRTSNPPSYDCTDAWHSEPSVGMTDTQQPEEILRAFITAEMEDDDPPDEQGLREDGDKVQLQCRVALAALDDIIRREAALVGALRRLVDGCGFLEYEDQPDGLDAARDLLARVRRGQG